jgi:N-acetylglutamate synthase-like GNAT family acetyltransferase
VEPPAVEAWLHGRTPEKYVHAADEGGETFWIAATADGPVIGFASWRRDELVSLFVDPVHHGRGVGHALFEACEKDAAENDHALLRLVATLNATSYYEALGFSAIRETYRVKRKTRIPHIEMMRARRTV